MERFSMHSMMSRGGAAAVLGAAAAAAAATAASLGAQNAGPARVRDTVVVRAIGPSRIPLDSIRALMRALDRIEYGTENWIVISRQIDSLVGGPVAKRIMLRTDPGFDAATPKGWIGLSPQGPQYRFFDPEGQRVTYLTYPLIVSVDPDSPAGRAGISSGDRLVAYDGVDVVNHEFNLTRMLVPDHKLDVTVRRDGERKDFALVIARTPDRVVYRRLQAGEMVSAMPGMASGARGSGGVAAAEAVGVPRAGVLSRTPMLPGNIYIISRDGAFGATMSQVTPDLARALKLSTGVLVNEVPESSPAWTSGLRAGDVVVNVGSQPVSTMQEMQALVQALMYTREVPLKVVRDHKSRDITVKW
ncbi:MAG TPA: PDZ domain-containing protein [Gemmatimonadaceae bacterium]|jgi:S1-C subfamily serine protease|nr:PDZ domain-containing protein [Gemmatimonadaceae bacterium]